MYLEIVSTKSQKYPQVINQSLVTIATKVLTINMVNKCNFLCNKLTTRCSKCLIVL